MNKIEDPNECECFHWAFDHKFYMIWPLSKESKVLGHHPGCVLYVPPTYERLKALKKEGVEFYDGWDVTFRNGMLMDKELSLIELKSKDYLCYFEIGESVYIVSVKAKNEYDVTRNVVNILKEHGIVYNEQNQIRFRSSFSTVPDIIPLEQLLNEKAIKDVIT